MTCGGSLKTMTAVACLALAACGANPPNTTETGTVREIKRISSSCLKIIWALGGCDPYYRLSIRSSRSEDQVETIKFLQASESDLSEIIGERITFSCYRAPNETRVGCSESLASVQWNGRELIKRK